MFSNLTKRHLTGVLYVLGAHENELAGSTSNINIRAYNVQALQRASRGAACGGGTDIAVRNLEGTTGCLKRREKRLYYSTAVQCTQKQNILKHTFLVGRRQVMGSLCDSSPSPVGRGTVHSNPTVSATCSHLLLAPGLPRSHKFRKMKCGIWGERNT